MLCTLAGERRAAVRRVRLHLVDEAGAVSRPALRAAGQSGAAPTPSARRASYFEGTRRNATPPPRHRRDCLRAVGVARRLRVASMALR